MQPIPETVSEEAAQPQQVDHPEQEVVRELPAARTTAEGIEDTGFQWDQTLPGETQDMPTALPPRILTSRVTQVSDSILFGAAVLGADTPEFQLIPAHRDRLRVTIEVVQADGEPDVYIGSTRNINETFSGWFLQPGTPVKFETRDDIYCKTVGGANTVRIQWAAELIDESAVI